MVNKYRLSAFAYDREEESERIEPQKIFFLSVEGNTTECEYFKGVSDNRAVLGINALVDVEVLKRSRKDTLSAPIQVIELLEEYIQLRNAGKEDLVKEIPKEFIKSTERNL